MLLLAAGATVALVFVSARASLSTDPTALAKIGMPLGGGTIQSVSVYTGPHDQPVPVDLRGDQLWPRHLIPAHQLLQIEVLIKRPGWIAWLAGSTERLKLSVMTPSASLRQHYLTLRQGATQIVLSFRQPVRTVSYGPPGQLVRRVLASPQSQIRLRRTSVAGTLAVAAAPRSWETSAPTLVSWFPAGAAATAVATPAPGTTITPHTKITLLFSKPVAKALGSTLPPVSPAGAGSWQALNDHTIQFNPTGYGYGLGTTVGIGLPNGVKLIGGGQTGNATGGTWTVPPGSPLRLQQLLSQLGYLPLTFNGPSVPSTPTAQEEAAVNPPAGKFDWSYQNVPDSLKSMWSPGASGTMTRGALMQFQNDQGLATDGVAGAAVWRSLINAAVANKRSPFGYTYVYVSLGGQSLNLWHNGHTVLTTPVNTGIPGRDTAPGTFPVYLHMSSGTMSGTNPDGSHYNDPGIPWISYFNGGDALHGFVRASYGSPQSLGCVEIEPSTAGRVWPYTPIGTLVHVA